MVRELNEKLVVDVYGPSPSCRKMRAEGCFIRHLHKFGNMSDVVVSLGVDVLDPMVERFEYIGSR